MVNEYIFQTITAIGRVRHLVGRSSAVLLSCSTVLELGPELSKGCEIAEGVLWVVVLRSPSHDGLSSDDKPISSAN